MIRNRKAFTPLEINRNRKNKKFLTGFTLIELIIVIVIIGILAAIAAPIMQATKTRAICAEAVTVLGTLRTALRAYYMEYNGFPVTFNFANWLSNPNPAFGIPLAAAGLPPDNLTGTYFSKHCYFISLNPDGLEPGTFIYATPHPEFFGNTANQAPRKNETDNIDDTPPGTLLMIYGTGRIYQSGISKSGYPSE